MKKADKKIYLVGAVILAAGAAVLLLGRGRMRSAAGDLPTPEEIRKRLMIGEVPPKYLYPIIGPRVLNPDWSPTEGGL